MQNTKQKFKESSIQAWAYEKQGRATLARIITKFSGYRREKVHATHQVGVWWHAMIILFRAL